jgi:transposase-like protein
MNELKNRGVQDVLIAVVDGLKGRRRSAVAASAVQARCRRKTQGAVDRVVE